MDFAFRILMNGAAIGAGYAIVALGFVVVYKTTRVLNFAQGALMYFGAVVVFVFVSDLKVPLWLAVALAVATGFFVGWLLQVSLFARLLGRPILTMVMVTIGLGMLVEGLIGLTWGYIPQRFPINEAPIYFLGAPVSLSQIIVASLTIGAIALVFIFFKFSRHGRSMLAAAENLEAAALMGVSLRKVHILTWAMGGGCAVLGGFLLGSLIGIDPQMPGLGLKALPALILGGLDSEGGAIVGGVSLGITEALVGGYLYDLWGGGAQDVVAYLILLVVLIVRPSGLFGSKDIVRV